MFTIEYKLPRSRQWHRASVSMYPRSALELHAVELAKEFGWKEWRIVNSSP